MADPDGKMLTSGISDHINLSEIGYGDMFMGLKMALKTV